ncbi:MAG: hypothetical protein IAE91_12785, partial [Ignavibacteriaceae bacterium]|nr:hypothetical protein [Ignavibacteriaceae bacterium]
MKKTKYLNQFILFLSIISGVLWLGAYTGRFITFYQIFDGTQYNINNSLININFVDIASIILPLISLSAFAFLSYIVFFLLYLLISKPDFKNNGWLIIISALFLITIPFELFLVIKYDFLLIEKIFYQTGTS